MNDTLLNEFLHLLDDAEKLNELNKRIVHCHSEYSIDKGILEAYVPGQDTLKERTKGHLVRQLSELLLKAGHIKFSERDVGGGGIGGGPEHLMIQADIAVVRPA